MNKLTATLFSAIFIYLFVIPIPGNAQGETTMLFLKISPSPVVNGMGVAGTALPSMDPSAFYNNPAQLGYMSRALNASYQFYPGNTDWLAGFKLSNLYYSAWTLTGGYNFQNLSPDLPFSFGVGYLHGGINYGTSLIIDDNNNKIESVESREYFDAFSFGTSINYFFNINAGLTYKTVNSSLVSGVNVTKDQLNEAKVNALDFGVLVTIPIYPVAHTIRPPLSPLSPPTRTFVNFSIGYAKTNIGDKVQYTNFNTEDPIPRTAKLGYALSMGIPVRASNTLLWGIVIDWTAEAEDLLIDRASQEYKGGLWGEINPYRNIILLKHDEKVNVHFGFQIQLLEALSFRWGQFNGPGYASPDYGPPRTWGFSITSDGLLKLLTPKTKASELVFIREHFKIQYHWSRYYLKKDQFNNYHPLHGTKFQGLTIAVTGF